MPVIGGNAIDHGKAYAGMVADGQLKNRVSGLVTGANIPFGYAAVRGAAEGEVVAPTAVSTADDFVGVVVYELNRAYQEGEVFGAVVDRDATLMTLGVIWVEAATAVAVGDPAFMGVGASVAGKWANAAGTGATAAVAIANSKFLSAGQPGDLVKLSVVVGG